MRQNFSEIIKAVQPRTLSQLNKKLVKKPVVSQFDAWKIRREIYKKRDGE